MSELQEDEILFEDNHLFAVVKRAPFLTQPDDTGRESLEEIAKDFLGKKYEKKGGVFLHAIHRLDREVGGIVLFAKSQKALSRLNEAMRARLLRKFYIAKVEGKLPEGDGELVHYLVHDDFRARVDKGGKEARLRYKRVGDNLLEIELLTGRYHQIRVQLAAIGCPIVGDAKYGSREAREAISLYHFRLAFPHPTKKEEVLLEHLPSWCKKL